MPETWCTACASVLGRAVKRHTPAACPLAAGSYCGVCASYGHSPSNCPDHTARAYREPHLLEQLIPANLLEAYQIRSQTPLPNARQIDLSPLQPLLRVPETEEALRAACSAAGVKPMICQEQGKKEKREITENKRRLTKAATAAGRTVVFVPENPELDDVEPPVKATKPKAAKNQKA